MAIQTGDPVPTGNIHVMLDGRPGVMASEQLFAGKKVVVFSLPGAFTPTCSKAHLPGFLALADSFFEQGIDTIACLSVNDPWVMEAWAEDQQVGNQILMLADGNGSYTASLGLTFDGSVSGMGVRGQRFAMIVADGKVEHLAIEAPGKFEVSSAEATLAALQELQ